MSLDLSDAYVLITGAGLGDKFGGIVRRAGDVDGDGLDELAVLAAETAAPQGPGRAYLFSGATIAASAGTLAANEALASFVGESVGDELGLCFDHGDFDGDGRSDVLLGARRATGAHADSGRVYLLPSPY